MIDDEIPLYGYSDKPAKSESRANQPAFPQQVLETSGHPNEGMTLRDYFAAKAMAVILKETLSIASIDEGRVARSSYEVADAMLLARQK